MQDNKKTLAFDIAQKFANTTNKGMELRTIKGDMMSARAVLKNSKEQNYDKVKTQIALYRESKTDSPVKINSKGVGKSFEVTTDSIDTLMEFLQGIKFVNDDMNDFVEFYNSNILKKYQDITVDLTPKSGKIELIIEHDETFNEDKYFESLIHELEKYNMGLIKNI